MGDSTSNNGREYAKKRTSKRRSEVWHHFTFDEVTKMARCHHCNAELCGDSSKHGTTHLKRHLKKSCKEHPHEDAAFGREELVLSVERNTGCGARHSGDKKQAALTGEERDVDDHLVEKRACLNKEQQLKRPIEEPGLNAEGAILIGEKNNMTVQLPQNQNGSILELGMGGAFRSFVNEYLQQQEAQMKELKEALDRAKAEIRKEKEARVAAEHKLTSLTEERDASAIEVLGWEDGANYMRKELMKKTECVETRSAFFDMRYVVCLKYLVIGSRSPIMTWAYIQEFFDRAMFGGSLGLGTEMTGKVGKDGNMLAAPLSQRCPSPIENCHELSYVDQRCIGPTENSHGFPYMYLVRSPSASPRIEWNEWCKDLDIDNNNEERS